MKKFLALSLAAVLTLSLFAACGGDSGGGTATANPTQTNVAATQAPAITITGEEITAIDPVELEIKKIRYQTWDTDELDADEMAEALGAEIEMVGVDWDSYNEVFMSSLMANNPPDVMDVQEGAVQNMIKNELFLPLDNLIDFGSTNWKNVAGNPLVMKDGQHHAAIAAAMVFYPIFFNKGMFANEGLPFPDDLARDNKWTWEKFFELSALLAKDTTGDGNFDIFGVTTEGIHTLVMSMMATHNEAYIKQDANGKYYNNVNSAKITDLMNMYYDVTFVRGHVDINANPSGFVSGHAAMFHGGWWYAWEEDFGNMLRNGQIGMAPVPTVNGRLDEAHMGNLEFMAIPRNEKNPAGGAALIEYTRYMGLLNTVEGSEQEQEMLDLGFTREHIGWIYNIKMLPYTDLYTDLEWWNPMYSLPYGEEWTATREWFSPDVQLLVDQLNGD